MFRLILAFHNGKFFPKCVKSKNLANVLNVETFDYLFIDSLLNQKSYIKIESPVDEVNKLKEWRKAKNISQNQAADFFEVARITYGTWERKNRYPKRVWSEINDTSNFL